MRWNAHARADAKESAFADSVIFLYSIVGSGRSTEPDRSRWWCSPYRFLHLLPLHRLWRTQPPCRFFPCRMSKHRHRHLCSVIYISSYSSTSLSLSCNYIILSFVFLVKSFLKIFALNKKFMFFNRLLSGWRIPLKALSISCSARTLCCFLPNGYLCFHSPLRLAKSLRLSQYSTQQMLACYFYLFPYLVTLLYIFLFFLSIGFLKFFKFFLIYFFLFPYLVNTLYTRKSGIAIPQKHFLCFAQKMGSAG